MYVGENALQALSVSILGHLELGLLITSMKFVSNETKRLVYESSVWWSCEGNPLRTCFETFRETQGVVSIAGVVVA